MEPFLGLFEKMNMPVSPESMGSFPINEHDAEMNSMLDNLKNANAWNKAREAIEMSAQRFQQEDVMVPKKMAVGVFPGDPNIIANSGWYTGFGGIPGYTQILIPPNECNFQHTIFESCCCT
jgi:uncharacterized protein YjaZ